MLILFLSAGSQKASAQGCTCIENGGFSSISAPGNMNQMNSPSLTVDKWFVSHGNPSLFNTDCPPDNNQRSVWMWAAEGIGEGIHTCYNFENGKKYQVCFWVKNNGNFGNQTNGRMNVKAANNLPVYSPPSSNANYAIPSVSSQIIASSSVSYPSWTLVSYQFQASSNYNRLWIYPSRGDGNLGNNMNQLEIQVDKVVVNEISSTLSGAFITASTNNITWCQSATLTVNNLPPNAIVKWTPAPGLSSTQGAVVTVSPCTTQEYEALIVLPNENCEICADGGQKVRITINSSPPAFSISGNTNPQCGGVLNLSASPVLSCNDYVYSWSGPNGFSKFGSAFSIPNVTEQLAGTYTLTVKHISDFRQSCMATQTVNIAPVNCPCNAQPDFTTSLCNPVAFSGTNTGGTNVVSWHWDFGDGTTSNQQNPGHLFLTTTSRTYNVCLTIVAQPSSGPACTTQVCKPVTVCPTDPSSVNCEVNAFFWPMGSGYSHVFMQDITVTNGTLCNYIWDFGDGSTESFTPVTFHTYSNPGTYNVCLTAISCVYDPFGNLITDCMNVYCTSVDAGDFNQRLAQTTPAGQTLFVFPNPAKDRVEITPGRENPQSITIYDAQGKVVKSVSCAAASGKITIELNGLSSGYYLLAVDYADGGREKQPLVIE